MSINQWLRRKFFCKNYSEFGPRILKNTGKEHVRKREFHLRFWSMIYLPLKSKFSTTVILETEFKSQRHFESRLTTSVPVSAPFIELDATTALHLL